MKSVRSKHSASFKAKVAIEALKEQATIPELAQRHHVNASMISKWKRHFVENAAVVFEREKQQQDESERESELLKKIGELTIERDFLSRGLARNR